MTTVDTLDEWLPKLLQIPSHLVNDQIYEWSSAIDRNRYGTLYTRLERVMEWRSPHSGTLSKRDKGRKSQLVGRLYEKLLRSLFAAGGALFAANNVRTTSNEVDLLLRVEPLGSFIPFLKHAGTHLVAEAKCHKKAPSSGLVNETAGFLTTVNATVGILFVFCSPRLVARDARTAIALHVQHQRFIVPIGRTQLEAVRAGAPIVRLLHEQYLHAVNHTTQLEV